MKKVAVVVLNYKVKEFALKCIESVKRSTYQDLAIIVVDNNSQDGIGQDLKIYPEVIFIQSGVNSGYTGGNNLGIKEALKRGVDYIFILNPDTQISPTCVQSCIKVAETEAAGIIGPKILFPDRQKIWYAGGIFDSANVLGTHRGVDEPDHGQYDQIEETDYVSGAAMFIKKEVFEKVGYFDERYFLYYEDSDLCLRTKQAGFKVVYNPQAIVYHTNAQSTGLGSQLQDYFITRNRMLLAANFLPLRTRLALLREALRNLGNPMRRLALVDFLMGRFGQGSYKIN